MDERAGHFHKKKLFYVLTSAGKPVWSKYGEETDLSTFIGSLAAILYKFQNYYTGVEDSVRFLRTSDMYIVFLCTEALYYVCISRGSSSLSSLFYQLRMLHAKVISTLTDNITTMLISRPNYDARNLMGGTHTSLDTLIRTSSVSPGFLEGVMPIRLVAGVRNQIYNCFRSNMHEDLLFGFLLTTEHIIYKYTRRGETCRPVDILLLSNVLASYTSLRSTMSWTPICLPEFSDKGFLYAYITFIPESMIGLALISDNAGAFKELKECGDAIERDLLPLRDELHQAIDATPYSVQLTDQRELKHFIYHSKTAEQYTMSGFNPSTRQLLPEITLEQYKRTLKRYNLAYRLSLLSDYCKGSYLRIDTYRNEQVVCWREKDFTVFASFSPLLPLQNVSQSLTQLQKFMKSEEANFFILK